MNGLGVVGMFALPLVSGICPSFLGRSSQPGAGGSGTIPGVPNGAGVPSSSDFPSGALVLTELDDIEWDFKN